MFVINVPNAATFPGLVPYIIDSSHYYGLFGYLSVFSLTLIINDMKRIFKKVFKSKKPSLGSIHGRGHEPASATSTSTLIISTTDLMPSIHASAATASAQVIPGVSVSVQLRPSHL